MQLLRDQKRQVVERLKSAGLPQGTFIPHDAIHEDGSTWIEVKDSDLFLRFSFGKPKVITNDQDAQGRWTLTFAPGLHRYRDQLNFRTFDDLISYVDVWAMCVRDELATGDPWEDLSEPSERFKSSENTLLSEGEQTQFRTALDQAKVVLLKDASNVDAILDRIDALERSIDKIGRKDLYLLAFGVFCDLAKEKLVESSVLHAAWDVLVDVFSSSLGILLQGANNLLG